MNKQTEMNIMAVILIMAGIFLIRDIFLTPVVIAIGLTISKDLRNLIWSFIKFLWDKVTGKETLKQENSPGAIQQHANGDAIKGDKVGGDKVSINVKGDLIYGPSKVKEVTKTDKSNSVRIDEVATYGEDEYP